MVDIMADEVWGYFQMNKKEMEESMLRVAYDDESGYALYLTEYLGFLMFMLENNGVKIDEATASSEEEARDVYSDFLDTYFGVNPEVELYTDEEIRRDEIIAAAYDFLDILLEGKADDWMTPDDVELFCMNAESYIESLTGIPCYHPIIEDGEFSAYPTEKIR